MLLISACGSGSGGGNNNTPQTTQNEIRVGYYSGTVNSSTQGIKDTEAMVIQSGGGYGVWMYSENSTAQLSYTFHSFARNNNVYNTNRCGFRNFQTTDNCGYTGNIGTNGISGGYTLNGVTTIYDSGLYNITANPQTITLAELNGKILNSTSSVDVSSNSTINFSSNGFTIQLNNECQGVATHQPNNTSNQAIGYTLILNSCQTSSGNGNYAYWIAKKSNNEYVATGIGITNRDSFIRLTILR